MTACCRRCGSERIRRSASATWRGRIRATLGILGSGGMAQRTSWPHRGPCARSGRVTHLQPDGRATARRSRGRSGSSMGATPSPEPEAVYAGAGIVVASCASAIGPDHRGPPPAPRHARDLHRRDARHGGERPDRRRASLRSRPAPAEAPDLRLEDEMPDVRRGRRKAAMAAPAATRDVPDERRVSFADLVSGRCPGRRRRTRSRSRNEATSTACNSPRWRASSTRAPRRRVSGVPCRVIFSTSPSATDPGPEHEEEHSRPSRGDDPILVSPGVYDGYSARLGRAGGVRPRLHHGSRARELAARTSRCRPRSRSATTSTPADHRASLVRARLGRRGDRLRQCGDGPPRRREFRGGRRFRRQPRGPGLAQALRAPRRQGRDPARTRWSPRSGPPSVRRQRRLPDRRPHGRDRGRRASRARSRARRAYEAAGADAIFPDAVRGTR